MYQSVIKALLVLLLAHYTKCLRRIVNGHEVNKHFAVYIMWDLSNKTQTDLYDTTTICGGFLATKNLVITADECLKIFPSQYVIAGYSIYVPDGRGRDKKEKECLEIAKKPIIDKHYYIRGNAHLTNGWQYSEVAVARVEIGYDFNDHAFTEKCSYQPVAANFKYHTPPQDTDVIMYGWGSNRYHRPENMSLDINQHHLMATTSKVISLEECDRSYKHTLTNRQKIRFCTDGESSLDVFGLPTDTRRTNTRNIQIAPLYALDVTGVSEYRTIVLKKILRRSIGLRGPCQNDHGGPVAIWEYGTEIVIGIITGYQVNRDMECVGPFLITRLEYFSKFIDTKKI